MAKAIEADWRRLDYDDAAFPDISARVLEDRALHDQFTLCDVLDTCVTVPLMVPQIDLSAQFGQPPVTLFRNSRFYIVLLFWNEATTSIHEHGFSGAFCVFSGSSLHVSYRFEPGRWLNSRVLVGRLARGEARVLQQGTVERIVPGRDGAHALFHLDQPSATLLIRTYMDARAQPQLAYHWPCYALDPFARDDQAVRRAQLLRLTHRTDPDLFTRLARDVLATSDFEASLRLLLDLGGMQLGPAAGTDLATRAAAAHPEYGGGLLELMRSAQLELDILVLRSRAVDPGQRLLLAFLLNHLSIGEIVPLITGRDAGRDALDVLAASVASLLDEAAGIAGGTLTTSAIRLLIGGDDTADAARKLVASLGGGAGAEEVEAARCLMDRLLEAPLMAALMRRDWGGLDEWDTLLARANT